MPIIKELREKQAAFMKKGDVESLSAIRMLISVIKNEEIDKGRNLEDDEIRAIAARQVKQLRGALKDFERGAREDLVKKTKREIEILSDYLPEQISDEELSKIIKETVIGVKASSAKDAGRVIGEVMRQIGGKADGKRVRKMVLKEISKEE